MILGFLFFNRTFLKHCNALSTGKYKRYINIYFIITCPMVNGIYDLYRFIFNLFLDESRESQT